MRPRHLVAATLAISFLAVLAVLAAVATNAIGTASGATPTPTPTPTRRPGTPSPTPTPAPPSVPAPASGLAVMVTECRGSTPNSVRAFFLWGPSRSGPQWLDLSIFNDGFAPGRFVTAGGVESSRWGYVWDGLAQGTTHFVRVNTLSAAGWKTSQTVMFYTPVCDGGAAQPRPAPDMIQLRADIAAAIDGSTINTAVAITDLQTGETVEVNGDAPRLPGCTINLFALMRVAADLQDRRYDQEEPGELIAQTINRSDPVTARILTRYWLGAGDLALGMRRVNDFMRGLGMSATVMDHPPAFPEESLFGTGVNAITARDTNRGLAALWGDRVFNPWWRSYMLYKMTLVKPGLNYLIAAGAGAGSTVSHKNGFLYEEGWADNDIGIVWYDRGPASIGYAISFFTENVPGKYDDIPIGQEIASRAYQWFVARYGYP